MKTKSLLLARTILIISTFFFIPFNKMKAQAEIPNEVLAIVKMKLEDGQSKLKDLGYEICASSLFGRKQDWYNEATKNCVTVKFDKSKEKLITEVLLNTAVSECQKGLEASRAVWNKYHDGAAPINSDKINAERKKLTDKGFVVSYWIEDVSPGRSSEYWVNETAQQAMFIVWETAGNNWVMTDKTDFKYGHNPAPKK